MEWKMYVELGFWIIVAIAMLYFICIKFIPALYLLNKDAKKVKLRKQIEYRSGIKDQMPLSYHLVHDEDEKCYEVFMTVANLCDDGVFRSKNVTIKTFPYSEDESLQDYMHNCAEELCDMLNELC